MPRFCAIGWMALFVLCSSSVLNATDVEFLKRDGTPVDWGTNTIFFGNPPKRGPAFKTDLGQGGTIFGAGLYRIRLLPGKVSSPDPQVHIAGSKITIDASLIDESLRCASAVALSHGDLYVAEYHSNDCTDSYVYKMLPDGRVGERFQTVHQPTALAFSDRAMFVLGAQELAAFDPANHNKLWSVAVEKLGDKPINFALLGDRLYVACPALNQLLQIDAKDGSRAGAITLPGEKPGSFPVAATPAGTLLVANAQALLELDRDGKLLRTLTPIKDAFALAVGADGEIAVAAAAGTGAFHVLKLDRDGKGLLDVMKTTWNDFDKHDCDHRYFAGLLGKVNWVGGLAFDAAGNLFVSDRNDVPERDGRWRGLGNDMGNDGGVVELSPTGDIKARLGSRFSDGSILRERLAERTQRDPVLRTRALLTKGGRGAIVIYGDSITQVGGDWNGGASDTAHNWTMLLPALFAQKNPNANVNIDARGIGGNVVFNGLSRAPQPEHPDEDVALYLLQFGTNDVGRPWVTAERYGQGLREFVQMLFVYSDADVAIVTAGPLPGDHLHNPVDFHNAAEAVAQEYHLPLVDIAEAETRALAGREYATLHLGNIGGRKKTDAHPNDAGHEVWAKAVVDTLQKAVDAR